MAGNETPVLQPFQTPAVRRFSSAGDDKLARSPCFTLFLLERGRGELRVDYAIHPFAAPSLLCLSPYQRAIFPKDTAVSGWVLNFHANFFCIETHHPAVGCDGVLFNDVYEVPLVTLGPQQRMEFHRLMTEIELELEMKGVAYIEILTSCLKILLIKATRLKVAQQGEGGRAATGRPEMLRQLRELLETSYKSLHRPSDYAERLGVSPRILAQLVQTHFHKTPSELIRDRVMKHAKWQLLHTLKPVKEIAFEVGFDDEFYFSRLFKRSFGCAPVAYREQETMLRGGANLSM